jgi:hypothetical protein
MLACLFNEILRLPAIPVTNLFEDTDDDRVLHSPNQLSMPTFGLKGFNLVAPSNTRDRQKEKVD